MKSIPFPSLEWLELLQGRMNTQPQKYQKFGTADCQFVLRFEIGAGNGNGSGDGQVDALRYGVVLDEYGCTEVVVVDDEQAFDPDFVLAGPFEAWAEMVVNIAEHGKADLHHSINRLTLIGRPLRVAPASDWVRMERFFQYNYTIQAFFDEGGVADRVDVQEPATLGGA